MPAFNFDNLTALQKRDESGKRQWFLDHGIDEPPTVMHIYDLEKIFSTK